MDVVTDDEYLLLQLLRLYKQETLKVSAYVMLLHERDLMVPDVVAHVDALRNQLKLEIDALFAAADDELSSGSGARHALRRLLTKDR